MAESPREVVERCYQAFAMNDLHGLLTNIAEDCCWSVPGTAGAIPWAGTYRGRPGVEEFLRALRTHIDILAYDIHAIIEDGERVVALGHEESRVKETGKRYDTTWAHEFRVQNGHVVFFEEHQDTAAMAAACRA